MYHKISDSHLDEIKKIIPEGRIFVGAEISEDYSHDELGGAQRMPDVLLKVKSTQEVSQIMAYANQNRIPVVVRGSGTGLVGASVAVKGGIMIETTLMNQILELDLDNLTVRVEPGVLLMELAKFAEDNDLLYPPDPGEKTATIGGNINTNAGGMRAVKYGVTRDYVRGLTAVLPDGRIMDFGGKVVKNSSGYSIKDLLIGSEGTLAVMTEAILKLVPLPACSISILAPFKTMEEALDAVPQIIRSKTAPTAIEYMSRDTILFAEDYLGKRFPDTRYSAYILMTFDGNTKKQVEEEYGRVADLCLDLGAVDVYIVDTQERKDAVWNARGAFLEAIKASTTEMDECDVVVPRDKVADFIKYTHQISGDLEMRIPSFGHAGDGNLHIYLCKDQMEEDTWQDKMAEAFRLMYDKAEEMGGQVSGEHGIGYAKKGFLKKHLGDDQVLLMQQIKKVFDPNNILNPGKVCQ